MPLHSHHVREGSVKCDRVETAPPLIPGGVFHKSPDDLAADRPAASPSLDQSADLIEGGPIIEVSVERDPFDLQRIANVFERVCCQEQKVCNFAFGHSAVQGHLSGSDPKNEIFERFETPPARAEFFILRV